MCGFLGQIRSGGNINEEKFLDSLSAISHRGPDARAIKYVSENILLGHHRLAILDLDSASNQPFESLCGKFVIAYNGEIYNYIELRKELHSLGLAFRTKSDTEVLLQGLMYYGVSFLNSVEGMFSFVFFDIEKRRLICARDMFGIKPLYYHTDKDGFSFSSEISPIKKLVNTVGVNRTTFMDFIVDGSYDHSSETFYSNVTSLDVGCYLEYELDTHNWNVKRWYAFEGSPNNHLNYRDAVSQTRELIIDSVGKHLRSDVPISIALSGGLDSSGITGIVRHLLPDSQIQTFSYVPHSADISEAFWIDLAAKHNQTEPHKVQFEMSSGIEEVISTVKVHQEPFGSSSMVAQYKVFKSVGESGIKVTLDGQGADELFCGYTGYLSSAIISLVRRKKFNILMRLLRVAIIDKGPTFVLRSILQSGIQLAPNQVKELLSQQLVPQSLIDCLEFDPRPNRKTSVPSLTVGAKGLREALNSATFRQGLPSLLRHADRSSMAHSVESRVPYLQKPLFEFASSLPEEFLFGNEYRPKGLLFDALAPYIPRTLFNRRDKIGFFSDEWQFLHNNSDDVLDHFDSSLDLPDVNIGRAKEDVYKALRDQRYYRPYHWRLVVSTLWARYCL